MDSQRQVRAFLAKHRLAHTPESHTLDLVSEVGEIAKALLEASDYGTASPVYGEALHNELGDVFFSLVALAESLDVDLGAALTAVMAKYEDRLASKGHCGSRA
jgi:NTP pyrophosphatase (non-canonical NTP hydrolase)